MEICFKPRACQGMLLEFAPPTSRASGKPPEPTRSKGLISGLRKQKMKTVLHFHIILYLQNTENYDNYRQFYISHPKPIEDKKNTPSQPAARV